MNWTSPIKLFLDDERKAPFQRELVKTADACIEVLKMGQVSELSLDHDLAEEHYATPPTGDASQYREKTGYDVVKWMVDRSENEGLDWPLVIYIHTLNPVGRENMRALLARYAPNYVRIVVNPWGSTSY